MTQDKHPPQDVKPRKPSALGKGYEALLGLGDPPGAGAVVDKNQRSTVSAPLHSVQFLPIFDIEPNPHQPRKVFDKEALHSLSESIKFDGVIQPIVVAKAEKKPGKYMIVAGERRWRASQLAGLDKIPVIIKETSPESMLRIALIENIQRAELSIIEEAEAYQSLISDFGLTQEQCAKQVGKDRTSITNALRLLALPKEVQEDLMSAKLSMGHGRALISLEEKKNILRARDIVIRKNLNVRQTEQLCKRFKSSTLPASGDHPAEADATKSACADLEYLVEAMRTHLRTKVNIVGNVGKGKIEVSYFSNAELERIVALFGVPV